MIHDLAALVICLRATVPTHINQHMGRAVFQFGLTILARFDETLAQTIHDMTEEKPFTSSGLMTTRMDGAVFTVNGDLNKGDMVWIRLTGLRADVVAALDHYRKGIRERQGEKVIEELNRLPWEVVSATWDHEWGGLTSYQNLIDRHRVARPAYQLTLEFASATTFRSNSVNMPFPLPYLVFGSLLSRWQSFTHHRLRDLPDDQVDSFIENRVLLSRYDLQTALYYYKNGGKEIGFTGKATFDLSKKSAHLEKHDPELEALLQKEFIWMARLMGLLADFARFSGIGRKTTTGMGMGRV